MSTKAETKKVLSLYFKSAGFTEGDSYRVISYTGTSKQPCWSTFKIVTKFNEVTSTWDRIEYVICTCFAVFVYGKDASVKGFRDHQCERKMESNQPTISFTSPTITLKDKRKITSAGCKLVASNLNRSFSSVDSDGILFLKKRLI